MLKKQNQLLMIKCSLLIATMIFLMNSCAQEEKVVLGNLEKKYLDGKMVLTDSNEMFELLEEVTSETYNEGICRIHFEILSDISSKSDGILSEIMFENFFKFIHNNNSFFCEKILGQDEMMSFQDVIYQEFQIEELELDDFLLLMESKISINDNCTSKLVSFIEETINYSMKKTDD